MARKFVGQNKDSLISEEKKGGGVGGGGERTGPMRKSNTIPTRPSYKYFSSY